MTFFNKLLFKLLMVHLTLFGLLSCKEDLQFKNVQNPSDDSNQMTHTWSFDKASKYEFDDEYIELSNGRATLKQIDTIHTEDDFDEGTHVGTYVTSEGKLTVLNKLTTDETHVNTILPNKSSKLVGYWRFDGDFKDSGNNNFDGSAQGDATIVSDRKLGTGSLSLDGNGDYVDLGANPLLTTTNANQAYSFAFWMKSTDTGSSLGIITQWDSTTDRAGVVLNSGNVRYMKDTVAPLLGTSNVSDGKWNHIVVVKDPAGNLELFVNGVSEVVGWGTSSGAYENTRTFIGTRYGGTSTIEGLLDDVAIWSEVLTETEIQTLYEAQNANFTELSSSWTPQWDSIVGYWKMDGNWQDSSGNDNHGTASGETTFDTTAQVGSHSGSFDGDGDEISMPLLSEVDKDKSFTIAGWIYPKGNSGNNAGTILQNCQNGTNRVALAQTDGSVGCSYYDGSWKKFGAALGDDEIWYHIACVKNDSGWTFYLNGVPYTTSIAESVYGNASADMKIGGNGNANGDFDGLIDEISVWSEPLDYSEILQIYNRQKQKYAGHYDSTIIDLGTSGEWTNLSAVTSLPFFKELTGDTDADGNPDSESSLNYSDLVGSTESTSDNDLMSGLVGLWHFDDNDEDEAPGGMDLVDSSGKGNHGEEAFPGTGAYKSDGLFGYGMEMGAATGYKFPTSASLDITGNITVQVWWRKSRDSFDPHSGYETIVSKNTDGNNISYVLNFDSTGANLRFLIGDDDGLTDSASVATPSFDGKWHHLVGVADNNFVYIYVDGVEASKVARTIPTIGVTARPLCLGLLSNAGDCNTNGVTYTFVDEVAIWNRALNPLEIHQLYRRGINRVKYQIKSCDDASCSGEEWQGPDGTAATYFSELFNKSDFSSLTDQDNDADVDYEDYLLAGTMNTQAPSFEFSHFAASGLSVSDNRYFQYRVIMESEDEADLCEDDDSNAVPCMPELSSVTVGPTGRYYAGSPSISNVNPGRFSTIKDIMFETSGSCDPKYQISKDGEKFYYWNGSRWSRSSIGVNHASLESEITSNIESFDDDIGSGDLYFKAYLESDTTQTCEIESIEASVGIR